jgi:hypothetical protein
MQRTTVYFSSKLYRAAFATVLRELKSARLS